MNKYIKVYQEDEEKCISCSGRGYKRSKRLKYKWFKCEACKGTGVIREEHEHRIPIESIRYLIGQRY